MWSALQTLHKVSQKARENNFYHGGPSHDWLTYYESRIESDQSCLNEWHAMDSLESRRPPSPDAIRNKPTAKEETESVIKMKLKEIMMSVDLDEVTSKYIRSRLEEHLDMDLGEFKEFIDAEMLTILGQMDAPTEIFEHVYLGSEWNASNLEELQKNGVRHILNVTREIDNFFPGMFDYFNVRVYDDEKTNLLKHWDNTYRYITRAKAEGSKVLVHCKMGVSRSASVVIAYAMKAYNWEFQQALQHVKAKRNCIKPNKNFLNQLETYRGMLDAMKNKEKLQRSKSETNLKSSKDARLLPGSEPTPLIQALNQSKSKSAGYEVSSGDGNDAAVVEGGCSHSKISKHHSQRNSMNNASVGAAGDTGSSRQRRVIRRSSSSSPKTVQNPSSSGAAAVIVAKQQSQSLENLTPERSTADEPKNMRFPGSNGENYSVTQNQVLHIQKNTPPTPLSLPAGLRTPPSSVRTIIQDLETHHGAERKTVEDRKVLNLPFSRSMSHDAGAAQNKEPSPVWTSSAKLITQTATSQMDDELERKTTQFRRKAQSWTMSPQLATSLELNNTVVVKEGYEVAMLRQKTREVPSRHASWGSGDQRGATAARMRNSSCSAYDTNRNNTQAYNTTSAAIYEDQVVVHGLIDANELNKMSYKTVPIPSYQLKQNTGVHKTAGGTVKRTKQKLEENNSSSSSSSSNNSTTQKKLRQQQEQQRRTHLYRSTSAAGGTGTTTSTTSNIIMGNNSSSSSSDSKELQELPYTTITSDIANKLNHNDSCDADEVIYRVAGDTLPNEDQRISSGNVKILKKNFEARASTTTTVTNVTTTTTTSSTTSTSSSLPSSPVAQHADYRVIMESTATSAIDASVKGLVHKYQQTPTPTTTTTATATTQNILNSNTSSVLMNFKPRPRSYYDTILAHKYNENRPPPAPIKERLDKELSQTVATTAQTTTTSTTNTTNTTTTVALTTHRRLQQHGKTHPLSRLSLPKQNFNTAAYNTM